MKKRILILPLLAAAALCCGTFVVTPAMASEAIAPFAQESPARRPTMQATQTLDYNCGARIWVTYTILSDKISGILSYQVTTQPTSSQNYSVSYRAVDGGARHDFTIRYTFADGSVHTETKCLLP